MTIQPFHMIVAAAANRGIGKAGKIPWRIPEDVRFFKNITCLFRDIHTLNKFEIKLNRVKRQKTKKEKKHSLVTDNIQVTINDNIPPNVVVMGRNTWESIPPKFRPMPNRINVVLSRNKEYSKNLPKEVQCYISLRDCLENLSKQDHGTIFLIGGGQIYNEGIKYSSCESLFITKVHGKYDCDAFFPEIPKDAFKLNDDITNMNLFANSMNNFEFVKGVQTNEKSGIKFEFQIYTRFQNIINGEILSKKLKIITNTKEKTNEIQKLEEIKEITGFTSSSPKSLESISTCSSSVISSISESTDSFGSKSDSLESIETINSDSQRSPILPH